MISHDATIKGEIFDEENNVNPFSNTDWRIAERLLFLDSYYNDKCVDAKFKILPNPAIETNDDIKFDTNLYDSVGTRIIKEGIVVFLEMSYNGAVTETLIVHEERSEPEMIIKGDLNNDGRITELDMLLMQAILLEKIIPDERQKIAGDINNDGTISLKDMSALRRHLDGIEMITEAVE